MKWKKSWQRFRKPKTGRQVFPQTKHIIKYAFTCGGIDYYEMDDAFNLPYERGLKCSTYYEEARMGVDREYLLKHLEAQKGIMLSKKINIFHLNQLNEHLEERVKFIMDPELYYKLASVVYFDANETPVTYDFNYNKEKIEHWKKSMEASDFFLSAPIKKLIPFTESSEINFQSYIEVVEKVKNRHWEFLTMLLSTLESEKQ